MSEFIDGLRAMASTAMLPTEGEVTAPGLGAPVSVRRDAWGVPYIEADTLDDLWFAQGFVTAAERLFQIDLMLRAASGRLGEVFAERTLAEDRFARTIGFHRAGATVAAGWDDADRAMHGRFREGVAAWVAQMQAPVEYRLLDLSPDIPDDEASWAAVFAYLAWGLSGNWDHELLRAWIRDQAGDEAARLLMPPLPADPPVVAAGARHGEVFDAIPRHKAQGSNDWVVSPQRTATGGALLANDPHLVALQPGAWIELHLAAPGYRARGVALVFSPGILLGTTDHHAWGVTNVSGDVQDLYVERLNDDGSAAAYEGSWEPLTIHREEILVRGDDTPHVFEVRETRHGPILDTFTSGLLGTEHVVLPTTETYALRWAGRDAGIHPSLPLLAARATSFETFREAALGLECPGQNVVYADVDGTIGYACTGRFPVRRAGDGTVPVPGWTAEHEWDGWIPDDELPWAKDPGRGFLATANHRIHDDTYPHLIGHDFHTSFRARRIAEVLASNERCTVGDMVRLQLDTVSLSAREILPLLGRIEGRTDGARAALALLGGWNGDMSADSAPAAVFNVWCRHIARAVLEPRLGADLFRHYHAWREPFQCQALPALLRDPQGWVDDDLLHATLVSALGELHEVLGSDPDAWRWGALHRLRLAHPLASILGLEPLFLAADLEIGGDEQTVMQSGFDGREGYPAAVIPSWRAVYDLADLDRSVGSLPTGVSGNPASFHWNDQAEGWIGGEPHPLPFTELAVTEAAISELRLIPG